MESSKRSILKRVLTGDMTPEAARSMLKRTMSGNVIIIVVQQPDGSYSIGNEHGLSEAHMKEKTEGTMHVIVGPEVAKLGDAITESEG